jgi:hypothetical protein
MSKDTREGIFLGWIQDCSNVHYFEEEDLYLIDTPSTQIEVKGFLDSIIPSPGNPPLFDVYFSDGTNEPM